MLELTYYVVLSFHADPVDETLEPALDSLMDALLDSETASDADILAGLSTGTVDVSMYVAGASAAGAVEIATDALADAIHRSGGLANWEQRAETALREDRYEAHVRRADLLSA